MANQTQLEMRLRNVDEFNDWHKHALDKIDLSSAYLTGADLTEANLSGADLNGVNSTGASLLGANLVDTNVKGAIFDGTDLELILYKGIKHLTGGQILRAKNLPFPYERDGTEERRAVSRQRATGAS